VVAVVDNAGRDCGNDTHEDEADVGSFGLLHRLSGLLVLLVMMLLVLLVMMLSVSFVVVVVVLLSVVLAVRLSVLGVWLLVP